MPSPDQRLTRARRSLTGLSVGDAFGELFFLEPSALRAAVQQRQVPGGEWFYTDDTEMALSLVATLREHGEVHSEVLIHRFAEHFDLSRSYGPSMQRVLRRIQAGEPWEEVVSESFSGQGSYGNGSAMRVGPLGAYFADDLALCAEQARRSSRVTHRHPEAVAGAIAVAIAAALAVQAQTSLPEPDEFLSAILPWVPPSEVASKLARASRLPLSMDPETAARILGNGEGLSAQDTVPFALWCAAQQLSDFSEALWWAVSSGGDSDTLGAIVGSIVALSSVSAIPAQWLSECEPWPEWFAGAMI